VDIKDHNGGMYMGLQQTIYELYPEEGALDMLKEKVIGLKEVIGAEDIKVEEIPIFGDYKGLLVVFITESKEGIVDKIEEQLEKLKEEGLLQDYSFKEVSLI
jgi:translation elongation factor EF-1beta